MELGIFQKLSSQLTGGKLSHLEFLCILKQCGDAFAPTDKATNLEKKRMMFQLDRMIQRTRVKEEAEKKDLAQAVESWLSKPEI